MTNVTVEERLPGERRGAAAVERAICAVCAASVLGIHAVMRLTEHSSVVVQYDVRFEVSRSNAGRAPTHVAIVAWDPSARRMLPAIRATIGVTVSADGSPVLQFDGVCDTMMARSSNAAGVAMAERIVEISARDFLRRVVSELERAQRADREAASE